jgi:uncharacterized protein YndB with AHSA1/START domain
MASKKEGTGKLVVRKMIPASREEVFDSWTDPHSMAVWMCPGNTVRAEAELDVRVGGKFRILMKGDCEEFDHTGVYRVIERPSKLAFTWISRATANQETLVTIELFTRGKQTELVLTHEGLPSADAISRHGGGWTSIVEKLAGSLARAD